MKNNLFHKLDLFFDDHADELFVVNFPIIIEIGALDKLGKVFCLAAMLFEPGG